MRLPFFCPLARHFLGAFLFLWGAIETQGQGILVPLKNRQDMVFDHAGKFLYITTDDGLVRRYNLSTGILEPGYQLNGILSGIDIAPNDAFLLVARVVYSSQDPAASLVYKIALTEGTITEISIPTAQNFGYYYGTSDVAIMSTGIAIVSSQANDYLHQIDLATNVVTARTDAPPKPPYGIRVGGAKLDRSEDGTRLAISEPNDGCFTFSAVTNTFGIRGTATSKKVAVSWDGALIATALPLEPSASLDTAPDYTLLRTFGHVGGAVAFDASRHVLYAASILSNEIVAFDTKTFVKKYTIPVGEAITIAEARTDGIMVASHDGRYLALQTDSGIRLFAIPTHDAPLEPPTFGIAQDMVFDHAGKYLYLTTLRDWVWPYNLATHALEAPYYLGGSLGGIDIAPDDSYLLVAQYFRGALQAMVQKVDLQTREINNIGYTMDHNITGGAWDVTIASNGRAFVTSHIGNHSGFVGLHEINLATGTVSVRPDAPSDVAGEITQETQIYRSADRTRLVFLEAKISSGPVFTYSANIDSFGPIYSTNYSYLDYASAGVSRDGSLLGLRLDKGYLQTSSFSTLHTFDTLHSGVAFDAVQDIFYAVDEAKSEIVGYNTNTYGEMFRLEIGETLPSYTLPFDVGNLVASQDGRHLALITPSTVRVFDIAANTVRSLPTPTATPGPAGQLANISTRAFTNSGDNVTIAGFIIRPGGAPDRIFLRAIGPSLSAVGVPGAMDDPTLELYNSAGAQIAANDNWKDSPDKALIVSAGLSPKDDREACIVAVIEPGAYTAVLRGKNQTTGNAVVELYDGGPQYSGSHGQVGNISTRGLVGVNDSVMIAGFITAGESTRILVRGIGPSLAAFEVPNPVQDPMIELHDSNGALIISNDNWRDTQAAEIWNTRTAPTNDVESAVISSVPPGSYTAILRGKDNTAGNGLVEVYNLQ